MTMMMAAVAGPATIPASFATAFASADAADAAVSAAFETHSAAVYGAALRATHDADVAADVMQEAFVRLLLEARAGRYPDHVAGWLHRTSTNVVISRARHESVARRCAPRLAAGETTATPDEIAVRHEEEATLRAALEALPATDRAVLLLAASGVSGQEIADRTGKSHGATRVALCRARARLRATVAA